MRKVQGSEGRVQGSGFRVRDFEVKVQQTRQKGNDSGRLHLLNPEPRTLNPLLAAFVALLFVAAAVRGEEPAKKAEEPSPQQIQHLIDQLGAKDYFVRQRAEASLAKVGFAAFDALSRAAASSDLEVASRAKRLLGLMRVQWSDKSDPPKVQELMHDYGLQDQPRRLMTIQSLAALPDESGIAALCRLIRYEKSPLLAKLAAWQILSVQRPPAKPLRDDTVRQIRESLALCPRPAAQWVLLSVRSAAEPQVMAEPWTKLVDAEEAALRATPSESNPTLVPNLLRFQVERLKKLGRVADAAPAILHLVKLEKGNEETLPQLLDWLIEQKEWKNIDGLAERFSTVVDTHPILLYLTAQAQLEQGHAEQAEKIAEKALRLHPGNDDDDLLQHYYAAANLQYRGLFSWAKREYRHIIALGPPTSDTTVRVRYLLSELQHDIGEDGEAAAVLEQVVQAAGAKRPAEAQVASRTLGEVRARMHYFYACHWLAAGDTAKQREALDRALEADPTDVDVLIACYRLPNPTPSYREKIRKLIEHEASDLREKINEDPEIAANYNQFAWLIGNTEGNMDEALAFSKKSLELAPGASGYYDTLGRVYFTKGDLENAVKNQSKAAEMEPHSGLIRRQLELFKKALGEKKKKSP